LVHVVNSRSVQILLPSRLEHVERPRGCQQLRGSGNVRTRRAKTQKAMVKRVY